MRRSKDNRIRIKFVLYIVFLLLLSISIVIMPFGVRLEGESYLLIYIAGSLFWSGVIGLFFSTISINNSRKSSLSFKENYPNQKKIGIVHFFQNRFAIISDIVLLGSLIGFIICKLLLNNDILLFVFIALFVFSFGMHCMLNGINYIYINQMLRRERTS